MEKVQPLERLQALEKKIAHIIDLLHAERERTASLGEEKNTLLARIEAMENSLLKETKSIEELSQERVRTKQMVDDLIQTIDDLVGSATPQSEAR
jgi:chromosome segregation ATPase